mmetsp:Transcript_44100/g.124805  ORF Transcript_44100/g.124805 Transcript_44100/m.124805 type:complete len:209 (-) Transcript_44100:524-1150(-)
MFQADQVLWVRMPAGSGLVSMVHEAFSIIQVAIDLGVGVFGNDMYNDVVVAVQHAFAFLVVNHRVVISVAVLLEGLYQRDGIVHRIENVVVDLSLPPHGPPPTREMDPSRLAHHQHPHAGPWLQRQHTAIVLEQHRRFLHGFSGNRRVLWAADSGMLTRPILSSASTPGPIMPSRALRRSTRLAASSMRHCGMVPFLAAWRVFSINLG